MGSVECATQREGEEEVAWKTFAACVAYGGVMGVDVGVCGYDECRFIG